MENNNEENIKIIKYNNPNEMTNRKEEEQKNIESSKKKKSSKLRAQRTKAPKAYLKEKEMQKKGGFSLFSCCLPSNKGDDEDD